MTDLRAQGHLWANLGLALVAASFAVALLQWGQIIYRLYLFVVQHSCRRWTNHIGNGDFAVILAVNVLVLLASVLSIYLLWGSGRWRRASAFMGLAANALATVTFFVMRHMGILVEHSEFIRRSYMGGG